MTGKNPNRSRLGDVTTSHRSQDQTVQFWDDRVNQHSNAGISRDWRRSAQLSPPKKEGDKKKLEGTFPDWKGGVNARTT